jgi:hypothetical protein
VIKILPGTRWYGCLITLPRALHHYPSHARQSVCCLRIPLCMVSCRAKKRLKANLDGRTTLFEVERRQYPTTHSLYSTSFCKRAFVDTPSTAPTDIKARPEGDPSSGCKLSSHAQEVILYRFSAIRELCASNNHQKAVSEALQFLRSYTPNSTTIPHESEISNNVINNGKLGLAGTGHGYALPHFFTSLPTECVYEVSLLIDHGVDVNATIIAHATDSSSRPPCDTALQLSAERAMQASHPSLPHLPRSTSKLRTPAASPRSSFLGEKATSGASKHSLTMAPSSRVIQTSGKATASSTVPPGSVSYSVPLKPVPLRPGGSFSPNRRGSPDPTEVQKSTMRASDMRYEDQYPPAKAE